LFYCTLGEIRNLTGLTDLELGDDQIRELISVVEHYINAVTGKSEGWHPTDSRYHFIEVAAKFHAAALCFDSLPETAETAGKGEKYRSQAKEILKKLQPSIVKCSEYQHIKV